MNKKIDIGTGFKDDNLFKVEKLLKSKVNMKHIYFVSSQNVYDKIIDKNV